MSPLHQQQSLLMSGSTTSARREAEPENGILARSGERGEAFLPVLRHPAVFWRGGRGGEEKGCSRAEAASRILRSCCLRKPGCAKKKKAILFWFLAQMLIFFFIISFLTAKSSHETNGELLFF